MVLMFLDDGIWIHPPDIEPFKFEGSIIEFFSIIIYHTELDIQNTQIFVHSRSLSIFNQTTLIRGN